MTSLARKLKTNVFRMLTGAILTIAIFCLALGSEAFAQRSVASQQTSNDANATIFYYTKNSLAASRYRAEIRRGNEARLYYDRSRRKWAVAVNFANINSASTVGSPNDSADGGKMPNGAQIVYFPDEATARSIHNASVAQGDWTKFWYDKNRGAWAVAVKPK